LCIFIIICYYNKFIETVKGILFGFKVISIKRSCFSLSRIWSMAEPKVTLGGVTLGKATVTRKHVRRGQDTEKKSRVQTTVTGGDTKDKQVTEQCLL